MGERTAGFWRSPGRRFSTFCMLNRLVIMGLMVRQEKLARSSR
jgi:hypothetical protein